jgi:hypothetical protein
MASLQRRQGARVSPVRLSVRGKAIGETEAG